MYTLRTRFARDIVCEFLPPSRQLKNQKVLIFADGMPTVPNKKRLMEYFSKKGFWVFHPRYRGSWESDGKFMKQSPHLDIIDVIDGIHNNFVSLWDYDISEAKPFKLQPSKIILIGSSFGGSAVILASKDKRVTKCVAISPVTDWTKPGKAEPLDLLEKFTSNAFGQGYRVAKGAWQKITKGKFYSPKNEAQNIDGSKVLIIHAKDDDVVPYYPSKKFAERTNSKLITLNKGGHLGSSLLLKPRFNKIFFNFISK